MVRSENHSQAPGDYANMTAINGTSPIQYYPVPISYVEHQTRRYPFFGSDAEGKNRVCACVCVCLSMRPRNLICQNTIRPRTSGPTKDLKTSPRSKTC